MSRRVIAVLFLGVLTAALDIALVATTLSSIQAGLGIDQRAVSWVLGVFVLCNLVGMPFMAALSDVRGRRFAYALCLVLFGAGSVWVVLSDSLPMLLAGRAMQGLAASGIFPVATAVVGDLVAPERRGRMLGLLGSVFGIAFTIGPILGGILVRYGWQAPFFVHLVLAPIALVLALRVLPPLKPDAPRPFDWPGALLLGVLLLSLAYGLNSLQPDALAESFQRAWPYFLGAGLLLPIFVTVERRSPRPMLRPSLMSRRQVVLACLFATGAGIAEAAFVFIAGFVGETFDLTSREASFRLLPIVIAVAIGSPVAGRILDRFGSRAVAAVSFFLLALGFFGLAHLRTERGYFIAAVLIGLGLAGLLGATLSYILLNESAEDERAIAQGIVTLFISVGQLNGAALIGAFAASSAGYRSAFLFIAATSALLLLLTPILKSRLIEVEALKSGHEEG
ncbi:MAG: MFS transporter [Bacteroidota bacterium]